MPALILKEARRTVVTQVTLKEVLALVVVVDTAKHTHSGPAVVLTTYLGVLRRGVERGQTSGDGVLLSRNPALVQQFALVTSHHLEVVLFVQVEAVFCIDVGVEVVALVSILINGIIWVVEDERIVVGIITVRSEPILMIHGVVDAVVHLCVHYEALEGSKTNGELMGLYVLLRLVSTTVDQVTRVRTRYYKVAVGVIDGDDRPVAAEVVVVESIHHGRSGIIGT